MQLFRIVETYFSIFFTRLVKQIFCLVETVFFGQCYFTASRNHYWNKEKEKQFWEKEIILASKQMIFWLVEIIFFYIFQRLFLASDSLFSV